MNYWIIADTHFGHDRMFKNGYRPEGFERQIINNLHNMVKSDDVTIHLGDVCFYKEEYWNELFLVNTKGKRWLIRGNHDKKTATWYLTHGWDAVCDSMSIKLYGKNLLFTHRPVIVAPHFDFNIHGHLHTSDRYPEILTEDKNILVSMEEMQYKPQNLRSLVERKQPTTLQFPMFKL